MAKCCLSDEIQSITKIDTVNLFEYYVRHTHDMLRNQHLINIIKMIFPNTLSANLELTCIQSPIFLRTNTGIQDDLAGLCESVKFKIPSCECVVEMVHSLAKWKRVILGKYGVPLHQGICTDMRAVRKDEQVDRLHSVYVDQWDWEQVISQEDRTLEYLCSTVRKIYQSICATQEFVRSNGFVSHTPPLPNSITFIHTEELDTMYPSLSPKERERAIVEQHGAVFLVGIGHPLANGLPHDHRAIDYDDWSTLNGEYRNGSQCHGLNGDILLWNYITNDSFEVSSMGIRVDSHALQVQSQIMKRSIDTQYHTDILHNNLPYSIGGGIGQSRLCMFLLEKAHIGEVQVSEWPDSLTSDCIKRGVVLL